MAKYTFHIRQVDQSKPSVTSDCPDDNAAQREATEMFADMARDIARELQSNPKWEIEVVDPPAGRPIFRLSIIAETLK
jgi:hypothetical protein